MVLMLCLVLSAAFSYAHSVARTEITGPFQVESGGELTVIMQECPDEATEVKQANHKNNKP